MFLQPQGAGVAKWVGTAHLQSQQVNSKIILLMKICAELHKSVANLQQICTFLVHSCLRKDQSDALFAIEEPQRSISLPGCPRYNFTDLKVPIILRKSDTFSCLFLLGKQSLAEE